jgi:hypothetical protein
MGIPVKQIFECTIYGRLGATIKGRCEMASINEYYITESHMDSAMFPETFSSAYPKSTCA